MSRIETALARVENFIASELGPSATEYAIMLALIVLAAIVAITGVGRGVETTMTTVAQSLPSG